jgi:hypothetical protein
MRFQLSATQKQRRLQDFKLYWAAGNMLKPVLGY